jgi:hypothetical protein
VRDDANKPPASGYLGYRRLYGRSIAGLLVFQAVGWGLAAGIAYLVASPRLAKDYFSAHHTVKATWELLVPALAAGAGIGFLVVGAGSALSVWRYSRRLRAPLADVDAVLRGLAAGRVPPPPPVPHRGTADEAAALLAPLGARLQELHRLSKGLQKATLELNYRAGGTREVTLKDLRGVAAQIDALSRDIAETLRWFEG